MDRPLNVDATVGNTPEYETFYEAYGYDSLVPNQNFAKLLNTRGELEIGNYVIKITPLGTFKFPIGCEQEFEDLMKKGFKNSGDQNRDFFCKVSDNVYWIKTFSERKEDYSLLYDGQYEELPDSYFGDDEGDTNKGSRAGVPEPDYGELGVQGWTDKKNWIGWSKTRCDEMRVGWRHVLLKKSISSYYSQVMKDVKDYAYMPPRMVEINGRIANAATLIMPDFPSTLKDQVVTQGVKAVYNYIKGKFGNRATNFEAANSCIISTPKGLYIIVNDDDVVKYNVKSYTHVFAKNYMQFTIGWNNLNGFFLNSVNSANASQIKSWLGVIVDAMNQKKVTLTGGEVYVCARFGENWRGMRIIKK